VGTRKNVEVKSKRVGVEALAGVGVEALAGVGVEALAGGPAPTG